MKLKMDEAGHAVLAEGKPVYIHDDGKEVPFDVAGTVATIARLNGEAKGHRERAEAAEKTLKSFEGIDDPAAALKALGIVKNLDDKKLVDAGEVEKVREEAIKAVEEKYKPHVEKASKLEQQLYAEMIGGRFARSKLIADKLAVPADIVQARFGDSFRIEDGKVVAFDADGNKLYSRANPGAVADFDEALELIIDRYPYKDHLLKASGASGSGAQGGGSGNGAGGKKQWTRDQFDSASQGERMAFAKEGGKVVD